MPSLTNRIRKDNMWQYTYYNELYHHGVPGMKWGVRKNPIVDAVKRGVVRTMTGGRYGQTRTHLMDTRHVYNAMNRRSVPISGKLANRYKRWGINNARNITSKLVRKVADGTSNSKQGFTVPPTMKRLHNRQLSFERGSIGDRIKRQLKTAFSKKTSSIRSTSTANVGGEFVKRAISGRAKGKVLGIKPKSYHYSDRSLYTIAKIGGKRAFGVGYNMYYGKRFNDAPIPGIHRGFETLWSKKNRGLVRGQNFRRLR